MTNIEILCVSVVFTALLSMIVLVGTVLSAKIARLRHELKQYEDLATRQLHDHYMQVANVNSCTDHLVKGLREMVEELAAHQALVFTKVAAVPEKYVLAHKGLSTQEKERDIEKYIQLQKDMREQEAKVEKIYRGKP